MPDSARHLLGAHRAHGSTRFCVWAPTRQSVDLVLYEDDRPEQILRMKRDTRGYWLSPDVDAPAGALYRYRLDGDPAQTFPDPASRFQPEGVHGPSEVIDPSAFAWETPWSPPSPDGLVFYEVHVGTFTAAGTFCGAMERLAYLRDLGVNAIEIMPVAEFSGRRNWGYDGVDLFAPSNAYGRPEHLRSLIDAAHRHGLAVFLDVVYNHLGPDGAYAVEFSPYYFTDRHRSPWGHGVNLDGPFSAEVRRFFIENALHWVREYHVDGLRLDATHALVDDGPRHFIEELTTTVREAAGVPVLFVAEDERDIRDRVAPAAAGGWGLDGMWADPFHHEVRVHLAGDREGYFAQYGGTPAAIARRINDGLPSFVFCIQNHDQVGNRADGARVHHQVDAAAYRAASVLLLLSPETPLLFMGQEWAASSPFLFFTDHHSDLGRLVAEGRRREFSVFAAFRDPGARELIPDPQAAATFEASRLNWSELERPPHAGVHRLYRRLLALRSQVARGAVAQALDDHTLHLSNDRMCAVVRLSGAGAVTPPLGCGRPVWLTTEDHEFVDDPAAPAVGDGRVTFTRPGAIVFAAGDANAGRGLTST